MNFLKRFYDGYLISGKNLGVFDPCSGLVELIDGTNTSLHEPKLQSYGRNWWGISIIAQLGSLLFGIATTKIYLYIAMLLSLSLFYISFSKVSSNNLVGVFLLAPFLFIGDFQEIYNSFPYSIFTIQLFLFSILILKYLGPDKFNNRKFLKLSTILGCLYNFIFWFNFHIVLTLIPVVIFLVLYRVETVILIYKKCLLFLSGFVFGFIGTTLFKWSVGILIYGKEISNTISNALNLRLSGGSSGLNPSILDYSQAFSNTPLGIRAIIVNIIVAITKVIDPRYASKLGIVIVVIVSLLLLFLFIKRVCGGIRFTFSEVISTLPIITIPFVYFVLTPNHSFNHAVFTYRAIPIVFGFVLSFVYLSSKRLKKF